MNHLYVVTVAQPWANAAVARLGGVEYLARKRDTPYRGRLFIHAGHQCEADAPEWAWAPAYFEHVHGAVIGHAELYRTEPVVPGPGWRWWLRDPVTLARPVPAHGWGGIWILPEPLAELIPPEGGIIAR